MAYFCSSCGVHWWPYQTVGGACPECGKGTRYTQEPGSADAEERHKAAWAKRRERDEAKARALAFELYCAEHEAHRWNDQLDELGALLEAEWRRGQAA